MSTLQGRAIPFIRTCVGCAIDHLIKDCPLKDNPIQPQESEDNIKNDQSMHNHCPLLPQCVEQGDQLVWNKYPEEIPQGEVSVLGEQKYCPATSEIKPITVDAKGQTQMLPDQVQVGLQVSSNHQHAHHNGGAIMTVSASNSTLNMHSTHQGLLPHSTTNASYRGAHSIAPQAPQFPYLAQPITFNTHSYNQSAHIPMHSSAIEYMTPL